MLSWRSARDVPGPAIARSSEPAPRTPARPGTYYWRIAAFLMPIYVMTPTGVLGLEKRFRAWVPRDLRSTALCSAPTADRVATPASRAATCRTS
jgi:hypothetical protein